MIVLDSLFPVFFVIMLGVGLKRKGLTTTAYLQQSDRLIYYIFFPLMLFWKIGSASYDDIDWGFCLITLLVVVSMFGISSLVIRMLPVPAFQAGSFSQSCYRFNTYIGVAVILNSFGEQGVAVFGILIGMAIPLINVFALSVLIWFSGERVSTGSRGRLLARALAANPLIHGCLAGILYSRLIGVFPVFVDNALKLITMVTLPMALLSIGGSLSFTGLRKYLSHASIAAGLKLLVLPAMGYLAYTVSGVTGIEFSVGMVFFCLPASTAIYVLSSQMNSDTELASSAILVSTFLSFFSLSAALLL